MKLQIYPPLTCLKPQAGRRFHLRSSSGFKTSKKAPKNPVSGDTEHRQRGKATAGTSPPSHGGVSLSPCPAPALLPRRQKPVGRGKTSFYLFVSKSRRLGGSTPLPHGIGDVEAAE